MEPAINFSSYISFNAVVYGEPLLKFSIWDYLTDTFLLSPTQTHAFDS